MAEIESTVLIKLWNSCFDWAKAWILLREQGSSGSLGEPYILRGGHDLDHELFLSNSVFDNLNCQ